jgi:UDP-N-acetyl-2-amino-2-deoxyglucuronate dehydrogenase
VKNFILIGVGGYIAPRHLEAIRSTGNNLLAALDKHDSVGVLDSYFPRADFFTEFERFDRHIDKIKRQGTKIDYLSVCSPNYLHDAHIRFGLRIGADVICEKPVVLNPWNVEALMEMEKETGRKVNGILQLRLHPAIIELKRKVESSDAGQVFKVDLNYITSRGNWYHHSWKGDEQKSGGIATNIGVHFFDMLQWVFGEVKDSAVIQENAETISGSLHLERANVNWLLSIDDARLPATAKSERSWRRLSVNNEVVDFSEGLMDLHTRSYEAILRGEGIGLDKCLPAIRIVQQLRRQ